jgi:hypothetical protein
VHSWSTFGARTSHGQTWIHKIHHNLDLGEATTFPLIVYSMPDHETSTQMSFCPETPIPKIPKIGTPVTLEGYNFACRPSIEVRFKQKCSPCQELSNGMWHAICTEGGQGDS